MADLLDRIAQEQQNNDLTDVGQARHDYNWASTFNSTPPPEVLRARVNYGDAINRAFDNKLALQARSDAHALDLMAKTAKFREYQANAPLREELLQRKIDSQGAHERFVQQKDAQTMADVAGFFDKTAKIQARPGTPEYQQALNAALVAHPRVIGTQVGSDALKRLQQEHQDVAALTPPDGMQVDQITMDENGKARATFKPVKPDVINAGTIAPQPGFAVDHYVQDSKGQSHAVFKPVKEGKATKADTYEAFNKDLDAAKKAYGVDPTDSKNTNKLPDFIQTAFEQRGKKLEESVAKINPNTGTVKDTTVIAPVTQPAISGDSPNQFEFPQKSVPADVAATDQAPADTGGEDQVQQLPTPVKTPDFGTPDDVKAAFKAGSIPREDAIRILREKFGHS